MPRDQSFLDSRYKFCSSLGGEKGGGKGGGVMGEGKKGVVAQFRSDKLSN